MSRYIGPKNKKLRSFEPKRRTSEYGRQLLEKQKIKFRYGVRERQFKKLYQAALKEKGVETGTVLLQMLEMRLDNVVYRLGLAKTRPQARHFVAQKKVLVDGAVVDVASYTVLPGQTVTLIPEAFSSLFVQDILKDAVAIPPWLEVGGSVGRLIRKPDRDEIDKDIDEALVVSFYSR